MDRIVEEIDLIPVVTQSEDDETLNNKKLSGISQDIQNRSRKRDVFIKLFKSNNYLKLFILWSVLFIGLFLIAGSLALHVPYVLPAVKARNIALDQFSEERARDYFPNLTLYGSRVSNTRGGFYARSFLISQIKRINSMSKRNLRFELDLQNFTDSYHDQLQNIIVRVSNPVTNSKNVPSLMLSAHYDSVEFSVGASDDGSGVVILLELFSNMVNDLTVTFSDVHLIVLFTGAEEMGLYGAYAFITNHTWRSNIRRFINIDAATCNEKAILFRVKPSQLILDYSRVAKPRANVITNNIERWLKSRSDFNMFSLNGSLLGYDFAFVLDAYIYHTARDDPLMIKQGVFQDLGNNLGTFIRYILLGHANLLQETEDSDPFIYFDILSRYLIVYRMSTSIIIQRILIISVLIIGIILILFDHLWHRKRTLACTDSRCVYLHFKHPLIIRIISIIIYIISNLFSVLIGLLFSLIIAWIMSIIQPLTWFGSSTMAFFLFSFPCLIGFISVEYLGDIFHRFILRKWPKNSLEFNDTIVNISFDFEQNFSVLFIYCLLMIISIYFAHRSFYIILVWSIFICPIYLLLMIVEFSLRWKEIQRKRFEQGFHWLFLPLIISLLPLTHTMDISYQLVRLLIPFLAQRFSLEWSMHGNITICSLIAVPTIFFVLVFIPVLQRTKHFGRTLTLLFISFLTIFIVAYTRQPFTSIHPHVFYAIHTSRSIYKAETLSNLPCIVPLISQSSSITIIPFYDLDVSRVLDDFSTKNGLTLHNRRCFNKMQCTFDDTFNRTIAVKHIKIESIKNFTNYTIAVRHVLSYNIQISSLSLIKFVVHNQSNIPRRDTRIDVTVDSPLSSFDIHIEIRRCDLNDSPFLISFTRSMPNMALVGLGRCRAINDSTILTIERQ